jgi:hypothetical protein
MKFISYETLFVGIVALVVLLAVLLTIKKFKYIRRIKFGPAELNLFSNKDKNQTVQKDNKKMQKDEKVESKNITVALEGNKFENHVGDIGGIIIKNKKK